MQGATFCISEAMWAAGDFRKHVVEAPQRERALVTVRVRQDNVAGVKLPIFTLQKATGTTLEMETLGLAGGGRQIGKAKDKFTSLLELLVKLGSLQTSFITLDEALKVTNRRVNALDNVAGVKLPVFTLQKAAGATVELETLGLAGGGRQIAKAKDKFTALLELLVKLGSLQTSFITLDEAIKVTNRRVNALDNVVIPSFTATIAYVTSELDEIEKEEFSRLKKVLEVRFD